MKYLFSVLFTVLLFVPLSANEKNPANSALSLQESFSNVAELFRPLVVSITAKKVILEPIHEYRFYYGTPFDPFSGQFFDESVTAPKNRQKYLERKLEGGGSGVIISSDGLVLTNYHVVSFADDISIHAAEKNKTYAAKMVAKDLDTDLAILKIDSEEKFGFAEIGDSDKLKVGNWVLAIGSPFGLEQTVTSGIVSARRQSLNIENKKYADMIQTDAAINMGNSGGPLVNINGEVVGINTAIFAPTGVFSGIGFAIPINKAIKLLAQLKKGPGEVTETNKKQSVQAVWEGLTVENTSQKTAEFYGISEQESGVVITNINYKNTRYAFGLMEGDIIKNINRQRVRNMGDFLALVEKISIKEGVSFDIVRNGKTLLITYLERKN